MELSPGTLGDILAGENSGGEERARQVAHYVRERLRDGTLDPNARAKDSAPLLYHALRKGWNEAAAALLEHGADPYAELMPANIRTDGHTKIGNIITGLIQENTPSALETLLLLTAAQGRPLNLNRPDLDSKEPPMIHALHLRKPDAVTLMGKWGANPNIPHHQGTSPLEWACSLPTGGEKIFAAVLGCGADLGIRCSDTAKTVGEWIESDPNMTTFKQTVITLRDNWQRFLQAKKIKLRHCLQLREDGTVIAHSSLLTALGIGLGDEVMHPSRWENPLHDIPHVIAAIPPHCRCYPAVQRAPIQVDRLRLEGNAPLGEWAGRIESDKLALISNRGER